VLKQLVKMIKKNKFPTQYPKTLLVIWMLISSIVLKWIFQVCIWDLLNHSEIINQLG